VNLALAKYTKSQLEFHLQIYFRQLGFLKISNWFGAFEVWPTNDPTFIGLSLKTFLKRCTYSIVARVKQLCFGLSPLKRFIYPVARVATMQLTKAQTITSYQANFKLIEYG
jgi:hypothetical protein